MCLATNIKSPQISKSKKYPTGQGRNVKRASKDLYARLSAAEKEILPIVDTIPYTTVEVQDVQNASTIVKFNGKTTTTRLSVNSVLAISSRNSAHDLPDGYEIEYSIVVNGDKYKSSDHGWLKRIIANKTVYKYEYDAQRQAQVDAEISRIINGWMQTSDPRKPVRYFWDQYVTTAYQPATLQSWANIKAMVFSPQGEEALTPDANMVAISMTDGETILNSPEYRNRIQAVYSRNYETLKGFSGQAALDLSRELANSMAAGEGIAQVKRNLVKQFDGIKGYRAERIARTELNKAHNDAKTEANVDARDRLGIRTAVMHISALSPTTRRSHADRSGNVYTPEAQNAWWNEGSNRINCLCSATEVLLDGDGKTLNVKLQKRVKEDRDAYFGL